MILTGRYISRIYPYVHFKYGKKKYKWPKHSEEVGTCQERAASEDNTEGISRKICSITRQNIRRSIVVIPQMCVLLHVLSLSKYVYSMCRVYQ